MSETFLPSELNVLVETKTGWVPTVRQGLLYPNTVSCVQSSFVKDDEIASFRTIVLV